MLVNSTPFVFLLQPLTLTGYYLLIKAGLIFLCSNAQQIMACYGPVLHWPRGRDQPDFIYFNF